MGIAATERQSARMSKITNDDLTRSGTGCFIAVPIWQQWASKGYSYSYKLHSSTDCFLNYFAVTVTAKHEYYTLK